MSLQVPDEEKVQGIARAVEKLRAHGGEKGANGDLNGEPLAGIQIVTSRVDSIPSPAATVNDSTPSEHDDHLNLLAAEFVCSDGRTT